MTDKKADEREHNFCSDIPSIKNIECKEIPNQITWEDIKGWHQKIANLERENRELRDRLSKHETDEIWKDVVGYEGLYQVSNIGRVRSLDRTVFNNGNKSMNLIKGCMMNPRRIRDTYLIVNVCRDNIHKKLFVHRMVATAFIPNPENKEQVNHIDHDKLNNHVSNLNWMTRQENHQYAVSEGRFKNMTKRGRLTKEEILHIRKKEMPRMEYVKLYGVCSSTIRNVQSGKCGKRVLTALKYNQ